MPFRLLRVISLINVLKINISSQLYMIKKIIESKIFEKDIFYILCTAFFYAIFVFLWHYNNNALPTSDAITYLEDAYSKYYKFYDAGFIEGLINLYTSRGWRPQIYAAIITPFLILTQGDVLLSITIFSSLSAFCLAFILYKILRIKLTPLNSSLLTLFILITPNIYTIYTSFFFRNNLYAFCIISFLLFI